MKSRNLVTYNNLILVDISLCIWVFICFKSSDGKIFLSAQSSYGEKSMLGEADLQFR
jgi:hypothetical protein